LKVGWAKCGANNISKLKVDLVHVAWRGKRKPVAHIQIEMKRQNLGERRKWTILMPFIREAAADVTQRQKKKPSSNSVKARER